MLVCQRPCILNLFVVAILVAMIVPAGAATVIDIGSPGDEAYLADGFHAREGPLPRSKIPFVRKVTFRWTGNQFTLRLPVEPKRPHKVTLKADFSGAVILSSGEKFSTVITGQGDRASEYSFYVPGEAVGDAEQFTVSARAVFPRKPANEHGRTLLMIVDEVRVEPLDKLPVDARTLQPINWASPERAIDRIRHIERRPPISDPVAFAELLAAERANIVTLGTMNGKGYVFFPTDLAEPDPRMDPAYLPEVIRQLRARNMKVFSWVVFNIQDTRKVDDYVIAKRYPQWRMKFIDDPDRPSNDKARMGMCVVSSPYIEQHAKLLRQAAAFDLDGFFFDGFYLGGIPHPSRPGCVCDFCKARFKADTGLELPTKVDWTDATFKRWVRWRNERLLSVARYFRDQIHEVNPKATCTFNTNIWPFANKDWETGIPMWRLEGLGVSQHSHDRSPHRKWMMLGFKARIGRDMNPEHTDMWRTGSTSYTTGEKNIDWAWHELELLTFLLAGPTHGITPWHGTFAGPAEISARIHTQAALREPYFSRKYVADVGVLVSQNTHDFWGHIAETTNLDDYHDGLLGTWMLLSENHVPFEFVFENQLDPKTLARYRTFVLPDAAALAAKDFATLVVWTRAGGNLLTTARTGRYDEWGEKLETPQLEALLQVDLSKPVDKKLGDGQVTYLPANPGLAWCRQREAAPGEALLKAIGRQPLPLVVEAPTSLVANMFENPGNPKERWVHLLNVSHMMPEGDSGFRGLNLPGVKGKELPQGRRGWQLVPARNIALQLPNQKVKSARLAIAGTELTVDADGRIVVPKIELHDVVVVTLQ